ncbi:MAG: response regulator transcription factor [Clostridiales Family XIII bacterium]|jgi:two-component system response regulator VicR|nr:response regulator transcription factor [Clostridiales Family XIII bacterium]
MEAKKVLIIEDEREISDIIKFNLKKEGFEAETAEDGFDGLDKALNGKPDLIVLDVMLPGIDGFEICKKVRETSTVPILMVTAKEEEVDKVLGLELGADDYITKPFGMRELIARIKANMRRVDFDGSEKDGPANIKDFGSLSIDMNRYVALKNGEELVLTLREFELLHYLAKRENKVFSREQLLTDVWGYYDYLGDLRTVDVTVRRLREKIEDDSSNPKYIITKRGIGYYFRRP